MASQGDRFRRRALSRGYKVDEVDAFLDRVEATLAGEPMGTPVASQEVDDVVFRVRFGGYDEWQVDVYLDRVARQLGELEERGELGRSPSPEFVTGRNREFQDRDEPRDDSREVIGRREAPGARDATMAMNVAELEREGLEAAPRRPMSPMREMSPPPPMREEPSTPPPSSRRPEKPSRGRKDRNSPADDGEGFGHLRDDGESFGHLRNDDYDDPFGDPQRRGTPPGGFDRGGFDQGPPDEPVDRFGPPPRDDRFGPGPGRPGGPGGPGPDDRFGPGPGGPGSNDRFGPPPRDDRFGPGPGNPNNPGGPGTDDRFAPPGIDRRFPGDPVPRQVSREPVSGPPMRDPISGPPMSPPMRDPVSGPPMSPPMRTPMSGPPSGPVSTPPSGGSWQQGPATPPHGYDREFDHDVTRPVRRFDEPEREAARPRHGQDRYMSPPPSQGYPGPGRDNTPPGGLTDPNAMTAVHPVVPGEEPQFSPPISGAGRGRSMFDDAPTSGRGFSAHDESPTAGRGIHDEIPTQAFRPGQSAAGVPAAPPMMPGGGGIPAQHDRADAKVDYGRRNPYEGRGVFDNPSRHGREEMTTELRAADSPFTADDLTRITQLRQAFQPRRFGSGYDPVQVDRMFDGMSANMTGRSPVPLTDRELDTSQFSLVQGGYFEAEVDAALREVRDIFARRGMVR